MEINSGMLIVVEGIDGCGKSQLADSLSKALEEKGKKTLILREPGSTPTAEKIRKILKDKSSPEAERPSALSELFLFLAARADLVQKVIRPSIQAGTYVIMDRFTPSTLAYQPINNPLLEGELHRLCRISTDGLGYPDVVLWLDGDVSQILDRAKRQGNNDPWDDREVEYFLEVRRNYEKQFAQDKWGYRAWTRLDAFSSVSDQVALSLAAIQEREKKRSPEVSTALIRPAGYRL